MSSGVAKNSRRSPGTEGAQQVPGLQLLEPHRYVRARNAETLDDIVGAQRTLGYEEHGIDLTDGAVDAQRLPISPK